MLKFFLFSIVQFVLVVNANWGYDQSIQAIAVINIGTKGLISGEIELRQASENEPVYINGVIRGLEPNSIHGFHVHGSSDVRNGCKSTGGHYNPFGMNHGGPNDSIRHVGDLGNIQADASGVARFSMFDRIISLRGPHSIIGRAFVVHSGVDDLGKGGAPDSLTTGNAGSRIGCGIIGYL